MEQETPQNYEAESKAGQPYLSTLSEDTIKFLFSTDYIVQDFLQRMGYSYSPLTKRLSKIEGIHTLLNEKGAYELSSFLSLNITPIHQLTRFDDDEINIRCFGFAYELSLMLMARYIEFEINKKNIALIVMTFSNLLDAVYHKSWKGFSAINLTTAWKITESHTEKKSKKGGFFSKYSGGD